MLIQDIEYYLDVRRATGYVLIDVERMLCQYAAFAEKRNVTYVTVDTAVNDGDVISGHSALGDIIGRRL